MKNNFIFCLRQKINKHVCGLAETLTRRLKKKHFYNLLFSVFSVTSVLVQIRM